MPAPERALLRSPGHPSSLSVLVLGGSGFIGRHAVAALCSRGVRVLVGSRQPLEIEDRLLPSARRCERRYVRFEDMLTPADWWAVLEEVDVVINCVGILRPRRRATYERVHHLAPAALATACRVRNCRLIHVSALGLQAPSGSGFVLSKRAGERAVRTSGADWLIVRPSLLDGDGGFGAKWLRRVARWPLHPVPADARGRIAALHVKDLGQALAELATRGTVHGSSAADREFDLGGSDPCDFAGYLWALRRRYSGRPAWQMPVPGVLARLCSHVCDVLRVTPFSYGHWELLRRDNMPVCNRLPELLGRPPRRLAAGPLTSDQLPTGQAANPPGSRSRIREGYEY